MDRDISGCPPLFAAACMVSGTGAVSGPPDYTRLRQTPSVQIPEHLREAEAHPDVLEWQWDVQSQIGAQLKSAPDARRFTEIADERGNPLTIGASQGRAVLVFSHPFRALDYMRVHDLPTEFRFVSSTAADLLTLFELIRPAGVEQFTIDRCPRCDVFTSLSTASADSPEHVLEGLAVFKATEVTRSKLYSDFAILEALEGRFESARDLSLEAVGHVTPLAADHHILIGQAAVMLEDPTLFHEALAYLRFLSQDHALALLHRVRETGTPEIPRPRPQA